MTPALVHHLPLEDDKVLDYRHPLYIGGWERSIASIDNDFADDDLDEPHLKRRFTILSHHPEIRELYGYERMSIPITILVVTLQIMAAFVFGELLTDWNWSMLLYAYVVGGSITQIIAAIIHETAHGLAAPTPFQNRMVGLLANIAIPFPIAMSFRRYHLEHHTFTGVVGLDPDLPFDWEIMMIGSNSFLKFVWILFYPLVNGLRGIMLLKPLQFWEYINVVFTTLINVFIWDLCGTRGLVYLFLSLWFGYSLHPAAAHYIQEHYTFDDGQETYSYYGSMNKLLLNTGYHNEHHDFTKIPWSNLPAVRGIAPEFYDDLAHHTSWFMVHWNFITQKQFGPVSRVRRSFKDYKKGRKMLGHLRQLLNDQELDSDLTR